MLRLIHALVCSATCRAVSLLPPKRVHPHARNAGNRVVLELANKGDMLFTGEVTVSGQPLPLIADTGSFEMVVFQRGCSGCPAHARSFFNPRRAKADLTTTDTSSVLSYGSGEVHSWASFASASLGGGHAGHKSGIHLAVSDRQLFWLADEVEMDFDLDGISAGIFGIGPPASALRMAENSLALAKATPYFGMEASLTTLEQVVEMQRQSPTFLDSAKISTFSICVGHAWGSNGKVIFNDHDAPHDAGSWVNVIDSGFWETRLGEVRMGEETLAESGTCTAIMDSGTTFIGLPKSIYSAIVDKVRKLTKAHGGCDDLTAWPRLEFGVGDLQLSVGPSSYVGKVHADASGLEEHKGVDAGDDVSAKLGTSIREDRISFDRPVGKRGDILHELMPHLPFHITDNPVGLAMDTVPADEDTECQPLVFIMMGAGLGDTSCQFLFGLPIFREYYVSHKLESRHRQGLKMAFARSKPDCSAVDVNSPQFDTMSGAAKPPLVVNPRKIRFPAPAVRAFSMRG